MKISCPTLSTGRYLQLLNFKGEKDGADGRSRTADLLITKQLRYAKIPLSYRIKTKPQLYYLYLVDTVHSFVLISRISSTHKEGNHEIQKRLDL